MAIIIKTLEEISLMQEGGRRHAEILAKVKEKVAPGVTTGELDHYAEELVRAGGDIPAFKGYTPRGAKKPFPATLCISINEEVVHGIPSPDRIINDGDVVSIDLGLLHKGVYTDAAVTIPVGIVSEEKKELIAVAKAALHKGIEAAVVGNTTGDIGYAIESSIGGRFGIVREYAGHGVGNHIHEDPYVPNYGKPGKGEGLRPGMTIAIEPMLTLGKPSVKILSDGYTVVTQDKSVAAHFEHTIAITPDGPIILTQ